MFGSVVRSFVRPGRRPARGRLRLAVEALDERITPSIDQQFDPVALGGSTLSTSEGWFNFTGEAAQSFTVGATGVLSEVDLYIYRATGNTGDLVLDIRATDANGIPTTAAGQQLLTTSVPASAV